MAINIGHNSHYLLWHERAKLCWLPTVKQLFWQRQNGSPNC